MGFSLRAILGLNHDPFDRGLKQASKRAEDFGKAFSGNLGKATSRLGVAGLAVAGVAVLFREATQVAKEFGENPGAKKFKHLTDANKEALTEFSRSIQGANDFWDRFVVSMVTGGLRAAQAVSRIPFIGTLGAALQAGKFFFGDTDTNFEAEQRKKEKLRIAQDEIKEANDLYAAQKKLIDLEEQGHFNGLNKSGKLAFLKAKGAVLDMQVNEAAGVDQINKMIEREQNRQAIESLERGGGASRSRSSLNELQKVGAFSSGENGIVREQREANKLLRSIDKKIAVINASGTEVMFS